jgi:excisionase family DNA binding protein
VVGADVAARGRPRQRRDGAAVPLGELVGLGVLAAVLLARLAVPQGGGDRLLSVREAARQLGLCTATIYGLCADGALPHMRILNAIRIAPVDLTAFIAARRR